jgi:CHRD domain
MNMEAPLSAGHSRTIIASLFAAVLLLSPAARAETVNFAAPLSGKVQVPPVVTEASGTFGATFDTATRQLTWKGTYSGLSGRATAAHFHGPADATATAPVSLGWTKIDSPFDGSATLTEKQAGELLAGKWYVNIHTQSHPGGEIRGQVLRTN